MQRRSCVVSPVGPGACDDDARPPDATRWRPPPSSPIRTLTVGPGISPDLSAWADSRTVTAGREFHPSPRTCSQTVEPSLQPADPTPDPGVARESKIAIDLQPVEVADLDLDVPMYAIDPVVRRGTSLQLTRIAQESEGQ